MSMPDKGFAGACSSVGLGHNSRGKSLKTSLIALSEDQVSISESEPVEHCKVCSGCGIVLTLVISSGCSILGFCAACGLCLLLFIFHNHGTDYQIMKKKKKKYIFFSLSCENVWIFLTFCFFCKSLKRPRRGGCRGRSTSPPLLGFMFTSRLILPGNTSREGKSVKSVCCPISSCCQAVQLQHWDQTYY